MIVNHIPDDKGRVLVHSTSWHGNNRWILERNLEQIHEQRPKSPVSEYSAGMAVHVSLSDAPWQLATVMRVADGYVTVQTRSGFTTSIPLRGDGTSPRLRLA